MIKLRWIGLDKVQAKYARIAANARKTFYDATKEAVLYAQSQIPPYPPPPPDSSYRRTGTLGRSITAFSGGHPQSLTRVDVTPFGSIGIIGTNVSYAGYVIDEHEQAYMHRGRWWTLQGVIRKARAGIVKIYARAARRLFGI